jgi:putative hydrolase of the HAD superfamily
MLDRKVILFDLGGVLVGSAGRIAVRALLPNMSEHQVLERWLGSRAVNVFERGQMPSGTFATEFIKEWGLRLTESEFLESFAAWATGLVDGAEALVRSLRRQHLVACLSNTNAIHWARMPELRELFDYCFASHLTGFMKPDREAYEHALRELRVAASSVYFFDDLLANVVAARAVGINAFHVRGFAQIEPILRAQGLYGNTNA